jgi:hypothetical protein
MAGLDPAIHAVAGSRNVDRRFQYFSTSGAARRGWPGRARPWQIQRLIPMKTHADILLLGTGAFAGRIAFDLAATARQPVSVVIAGRNGPRLDWLRTAANARAAIFGTQARFTTEQTDLLRPDAPASLMTRLRPAVVVQAASVQTSAVIATAGDGWSRLVAEGGLSATAVFQAVLSARVARAMRDEHPAAHLINCCFPDVVNGLLVASGLPVTCGTGNVAILANAFIGVLAQGAAVQVLAHYQTLGAWRRPAAERAGPAPRVWVSGQEVANVFGRFRDVLLTTEPAIEISGAAGVPLILAIATGQSWSGHVPGPFGLPGGYPARWQDGALALDLPPGLSRDAAIAWNAQFETANGMVLDGVRACYTGRLQEELQKVSPQLAEGFDVSDLDLAYRDMEELRARLQARA